MKSITPTSRYGRVPLVFELVVWLVYVCLYKYSYFLSSGDLPNPNFDNFPWPQLIIYSVAMTVYTIPFYRIIAPKLLLARKFWLLFFVTILYFGIVLKLHNWVVTWLFQQLYPSGTLHEFFVSQHAEAAMRMKLLFGWSPNLFLTDLLAFLSVGFMRYAFENERKKFMLEKDNLVLQLESLKAQLHPHFLFNTLNSIYAMSLTGHKETSGYILRLSDMMRYILYDCQQHYVPLEKDLSFIQNYIAMEQARYPEADIQFTIKGGNEVLQIVPLLFIQFIENSFKHGAHRVNDKGYIHGSLEVSNGRVHFNLANDLPEAGGFSMFKHNAAAQQTAVNNGTVYGGIGIKNVEKRLEMFYPGRHKLNIKKDEHRYEVTIDIIINGPY
ncbi:histidine kinase [Pseudoflavitalea sp. G-6-1-2]|uniref:sensor histidine kinase n=1 Tax=Pseudoflavitalea sp. G-6-1-2 TaxID=2728841 RepID=UPI00146B2C36|nr:sensor histidine kinase [Pseudoflavitalea sp. G-6-1-2]NML19317.1 histidine kinase [Pseudoflavitalea sp. G-6-1-2]